MIQVAYAPIYKYQLPINHRFPMEKYELLPQQLLYEGTLIADHFFAPDRLSDDILLLTHDPAYIAHLKGGTLPKKMRRKIGFPVRPDLIERGLHIAQGTIDCALAALNGGVALNIAGGTHHAFADRGEGFCVFNDFAIAANYLLCTKRVHKVLIVDLDVHQGNGTAHIFRNNPSVYTFSMHGAKNYPLRKEESDWDIALPDHTKDALYLTELRNAMPKLLMEQKPDIVFYLAGADVIQADALGRLDLTIQGAKQRDAIVFDHCRREQIPVVVSMGGGYAPQIRDIIEVHANTFRVAIDMYE